MSSDFELLAEETVYPGKIASVKHGRFRHADGQEVDREWVAHPGAVAIVAHDGERIWLVRQPREAVGEPDLLELPAGKLDVEGEAPLDCARRELSEEIGKAAARWEPLKRFYTSAGFTDETIELWLATELSLDPHAEAQAGERIDVVSHPLDDLDAVLAEVRDAKTLIGLLLLRERLRG